MFDESGVDLDDTTLPDTVRQDSKLEGYVEKLTQAFGEVQHLIVRMLEVASLVFLFCRKHLGLLSNGHWAMVQATVYVLKFLERSSQTRKLFRLFVMEE